MPMPDYILKALFVTTGLLLAAVLFRLLPHARHPVPRGLIHAVLGLDALLVGNTVAGVFGLGLGLNAVTVPAAAGLGLPGVAALWAFRYIL